MSEIRIASRYAKSLLELAVEQKSVDSVMKDMEQFEAICRSSSEFVRVLKNPVISHFKKLTILREIFKGKAHKMTLSMLEIVSRKNREKYLPEIAKEFKRQYNVHKGIVEATVTTVIPLNKALQKEFSEVVKKLTGKEVELEEVVDPTILGGFVLKIGDRQIDDSINTRLKELKLEFSQNSYINKM